MSQRITFHTTLVQREKLDEWLEKQKSIGSFVLVIPIILLVNISSMSFNYRVRRCMVLLELLYFNVHHISKRGACQRTNNPIKKKLPPLNSVAVPITPWRQVGLDLIGPLPETDPGYKYVATMILFLKVDRNKSFKIKKCF